MSETKHTPGPWVASRREGSPWNVKISATEAVAIVFGTAMQGTAAQAEANARLIAAAPELLATIKALLSETESLHLYYNETLMDEGCSAVSEDISIINARAIIAKAEGK